VSFALDLQRFAEKAGDKADAVVRKVTLDVYSRLIEKSPVDTGRFRNNWQIGYNLVDSTTTNAKSYDSSGASAVARAYAEIYGKPIPGAYFLTNSLPYAERLEDGYSGQAPLGMVRITVVEFKSIVQKAI